MQKGIPPYFSFDILFKVLGGLVGRYGCESTVYESHIPGWISFVLVVLAGNWWLCCSSKCRYMECCGPMWHGICVD